MDFLAAHLLVASPQLPDPNFSHSVVLMIQHDDDGAFGLILNRPTNVKLKAIWQEISDAQCESEGTINHGGPVSGPLMAVHTRDSCCETEILPGLYLATQKEHLNELVAQSDDRYRMFCGYAGWGGGQLDGELEAGGWLTAPATLEHVFAEPSELWKRVAAGIGSDLLMSAIRPKHVPDDPTVN